MNQMGFPASLFLPHTNKRKKKKEKKGYFSNMS